MTESKVGNTSPAHGSFLQRSQHRGLSGGARWFGHESQMKGIFSLRKAKPPRRQLARAGYDSPSTRSRDWQRHSAHKGSQALCCPLASPVEPPRSRAWLLILAHSKLKLFLFRRKGEISLPLQLPSTWILNVFPTNSTSNAFHIQKAKNSTEREMEHLPLLIR